MFYVHTAITVEFVAPTKLSPPMKPTTQLVQLNPLEQLQTGRLTRRLTQLVVGLSFFGLSMAMMIRGNLGLAPWDALHMGLTQHFPISFGWAVFIVSVIVMLLWIPLREMPGIGTIANAVVISAVADFSLSLLPTVDNFTLRLVLTVGGVWLCGFGSALYIGTQLGRGPRDGLMTGISRKTGLSLRLIRTLLEVSALSIGLVLAGLEVLGIGTVLFALLIGPLTQAMLPWVMIHVQKPE